jgi:hypothetical protein
MKHLLASVVIMITVLLSFSQQLAAQAVKVNKQPPSYFIDVHHFGPGKVTVKDVEAAHQKDIRVERKYGVTILKYWFDQANGDVYCLSSANDEESIRNTHTNAHGLLPDEFYQVTEGVEAAIKGNHDLYLDIHQLRKGKVSAADVAGAHQKDLAVQGKYGVNLINYWVDLKKGTVMCLAQAPDSAALINTHKQAHGLLPLRVVKIKQGY